LLGVGRNLLRGENWTPWRLLGNCEAPWRPVEYLERHFKKGNKDWEKPERVTASGVSEEKKRNLRATARSTGKNIMRAPSSIGAGRHRSGKIIQTREADSFM